MQTVHIGLTEDQINWLKERFPTAGRSKAIRTIIDKHIRLIQSYEAEETGKLKPLILEENK